jgi:[protein-PII] uridylyltransferase
MSKTTQRQDIYDPKTIRNFCNLLPCSEYLDYLYLLTVADICATNPALWNAWKDSMLKELYLASKKLMQEDKAMFDETGLINARRENALKILKAEGIHQDQVHPLWHNFKNNYFLHESPETIALHTRTILECKQTPVILIMPHHSQGGTEVFIYMPHRDDRFTLTTTILSNQHATIQEANILTCDNQYDLDTYIILDEQNRVFFDQKHIDEIYKALKEHLLDKGTLPTIKKRRLSRTQAHFNLTPKITFTEDQERKHTCLFLITSDRPGLLAHISKIFLDQNIHLHNAKITTAGERAEDMFYITNKQGNVLDENEKQQLTEKLMEIRKL